MQNFLGAIWKQAPIFNEGFIIWAQFGIVAKKSDGDESWKAYCGAVIHDEDNADINQEKKDIQFIMENGAVLTEAEARAWFPNIKLKYRD